MPADNPRIFISYSRQDGEDFATDLRQKLIAIFGEDQLWQDRAKMEGGVGWWSQIEQALEAVEFMVLVATPEAMKSPIVAKEWRRARQEGVCVYPVQVPGLPIDFKTFPRWMADSHFYNLDKEWDTFVNYLKSPCTAVKVPFMPPPLPEHFVERPGEFNALRDLLLDADRQNPLAITTALKGAGGFGKTTLAAALCHDEDVQTAFDDGILWATLGEQPDVLGALTKLYAALTGERPAFVDAEDAANNLADKLTDRDCLIVIDDAWNTAHLRPFLRGGERCARLITTRIMDVALEAEAQPLTVDEMETDEAAQMLIAGIQPASTDPEPFRRLAKRLGEWPLALKLANGAIRKRILRRDTPEKAARWLEDELRTEGVQVLKSDDANQRSRSAGATLEITFQILDETERIDLRHRFATLGVFYEDTDIPFTALAALWGCTPREAERHATRLDDLSLLLRLDLESGTIRLHDVVRQYALSLLTDAPAQHNRLLEGWGDPYALPDAFAWTWYIYHLREAGRDPAECLLDFRWLRAKLLATNPNALLADFDLALTFAVGAQHVAPASNTDAHNSPRPEGEGLGVRVSNILPLLQSAVRMSLHILAADPRQLPAQINGRLAHHRAQPAVAHFLDSVEPDTFFPINTHPTHLPAGGALLRTLSGHSRAVNGAFALSDGRFLSWSSDNTLRLWNASGEAFAVLKGHTHSVFGALLLPDERVLSWSADGTLHLWSISGEEMATLIGHTNWVSGALLLPDEHILSWSLDGTLLLWNTSGQLLATLTGHTDSVTGALLLPDGRILSWGGDTDLRLWSVSGDLIAVLEGHTQRVKGALTLNDGRILSWSLDDTLRLWTTSGQPVAIMTRHTSGVTGALALADGRILSWGWGKNLCLWSTSGQLLALLKGHTNSVVGAMSLPDGHMLSWSSDNTLRLWTDSGQPLAVLKGHTRSVTGVLLLPNDQILSRSEDGTLLLWNTSGQPLAVLEGHTDGVSGALLLHDKRLLSWSADGTLRLWNISNQPLAALEGHTGSVDGALFLPDKRLLSWSADGTLCLWSASGQPLTTLIGHTWDIHGALSLPDSRFLSWARDKTLRLWSASGEPLTTLEGHTGSVDGVLTLPDGRFLSWSHDDTLRLWSNDGSPISALSDHSHWVFGALLLPDDRFLSWSADNTLRLWSNDGHPITTLTGHSDSVFGATLLPDGRFLSWSADNTLRLWSNDGSPLTSLTGHSDSVFGTLALPDGRFLSWSTDNTLRLWSSNGLFLASLTGHSGWVLGAFALPNGRFLSWSRDNTLRLWSSDGKPLATLTGHSSSVSGAIALPDGRFLSWSSDATLRLWSADGSPIAAFYADAPVTCCVLGQDDVIVAGDRVGRVLFLRLVE